MRVRAGGLLAPAGARRRAALRRARLGLPARRRGAARAAPARVRALHVNYGLRDEAGDDERHCAALCERLGVALTSSAPTPPGGGRQHPGVGARRALRGRGEAALARRRAARVVAAGHTADDQVETILYRLASSPGRRALLGMRAARRAARAPAARRHARADDRLLRAARARLARRRRPTTATDTRATACATALVPALEQIHPAAARERRCAPPRCCATRREVLDALVGDAARRRPATEIALERLRRAAARAARGSSCGGSPTAPPGSSCPGAAARRARSLALRRTGRAMLDVGGGARAVVRARRAARRARRRALRWPGLA